MGQQKTIAVLVAEDEYSNFLLMKTILTLQNYEVIHALMTDSRKAFDAGCDDYLSKPFKSAELLEKIDQLLGSTSGE